MREVDERPMRHDDRGSAGVEAAIAVTSLLLVGFFIIGAIRVVGSGGDVDAAARFAARAAAAEYEPGSASAAAEEVASQTLAARGVACQNLTVTVEGDLSPGSVVVVEVTCNVSLADVVLAGFPGRRTVTGRGVEQVDVVRGGQA
jgi:Flp pilus assembly protein TadG